MPFRCNPDGLHPFFAERSASSPLWVRLSLFIGIVVLPYYNWGAYVQILSFFILAPVQLYASLSIEPNTAQDIEKLPRTWSGRWISKSICFLAMSTTTLKAQKNTCWPAPARACVSKLSGYVKRRALKHTPWDLTSSMLCYPELVEGISPVPLVYAQQPLTSARQTLAT